LQQLTKNHLSAWQNHCQSTDSQEPQHTTLNQQNRVTSYLVQLPSSLQGIRCYTDASTQPDVSQVIPRPAGIGIFIVNTEMQSPFSMFLKVAMQDSTSVIMAESAALALATSLCNTMDFHDAHFLSDNQMLVNCINGADPSNPRIGGLNLLLN
jgi:hypothetical protein